MKSVCVSAKCHDMKLIVTFRYTFECELKYNIFVHIIEKPCYNHYNLAVFLIEHNFGFDECDISADY